MGQGSGRGGGSRIAVSFSQPGPHMTLLRLTQRLDLILISFLLSFLNFILFLFFLLSLGLTDDPRPA